ncbi:hypothetical protein [Microbacterium sp.]|uniref:hypothetical protein n=1 Tax=Microbacterium sp. TaxID=51671 RepID=UPI00262D30E6|nr:hypothetical protein [Microbacterium sp.]
MTGLSDFQQENRIVFETEEPGYEHGVEQTVLSGPGLQLLNPTARDQYQHRLHDVDGSVSELFQANARWRQCDLLSAPSEEEQKQLRSWFLASGRTYTTVDGDTSGIQIPLDQVPAPLGPGLAALAEIGGDSGVLYASDIVVVWQGHTWLLPASSDRLVRMRRISDTKLQRLRAAVPEDKRSAFDEAAAIVSVTTVPWRIEIMQGPRGYRVALQQSGLLLAATMQILSRSGGAPIVATEFADVVVDDVLDQDGVERFTTALVAVSARAQAPQHPQAGPADGQESK